MLQCDHFTPVLEAGKDIVYVAMSSGISGTYNAAVTAATELMESFKSRFIHIVDSRGCGFGNGLLAVHAAELSDQNVDVREASDILDKEVPHMCQYFTVDDLNFLKRTGRVSGFTAKIAGILNIKTILYGTSGGEIVSCETVRGRKKSIDAIVRKYKEKLIYDLPQTVCISHGDCLDDAKTLEAKVKEITPDMPVVICQHEPFSGAHVGPGMLALFFRGTVPCLIPPLSPCISLNCRRIGFGFFYVFLLDPGNDLQVFIGLLLLFRLRLAFFLNERSKTDVSCTAVFLSLDFGFVRAGIVRMAAGMIVLIPGGFSLLCLFLGYYSLFLLPGQVLLLRQPHADILQFIDPDALLFH